MKEQVIASRGVRRSAGQAKGFVQKPARRNGSGRAREFGFSPRSLFAYLPKALKVVLGILILVTVIVGYRVAASAALFQVHTIDVTGTSRTSAEEIAGLTRRAIIRTGVWRADLTTLSNELSRLPGVRRAVVSRVLPDGLRVRITERAPLAVVRTAAGHFVWVDEEGVALGEMKPDDRMPAFFLRGWNEDDGEDARAENIERMKKYQEALREWDAAGLSERVSEVTMIDVRDVRAQLAGGDSQIEVRLGGQDLGSRLKYALEALDMVKQTPRGSAITYIDVQTGRVVVGFASGNKLTSETAATAESSADSATTEPSAVSSPTPKPTKSPKPSSKDNAAAAGRRNDQKPNSQRAAPTRFR